MVGSQAQGNVLIVWFAHLRGRNALQWAEVGLKQVFVLVGAVDKREVGWKDLAEEL